MGKTIPEIIKKAFAFEMENFKGKIERLGVKDGVEWFFSNFPRFWKPDSQWFMG